MTERLCQRWGGCWTPVTAARWLQLSSSRCVRMCKCSGGCSALSRESSWPAVVRLLTVRLWLLCGSCWTMLGLPLLCLLVVPVVAVRLCCARCGCCRRVVAVQLAVG